MKKMNLKSVLTLVVIVLFVSLAVAFLNRNGSGRNDLSRSLDRAADNIEEGAQDAQRSIEDALD